MFAFTGSVSAFQVPGIRCMMIFQRYKQAEKNSNNVVLVIKLLTILINKNKENVPTVLIEVHIDYSY